MVGAYAGRSLGDGPRLSIMWDSLFFHRTIIVNRPRQQRRREMPLILSRLRGPLGVQIIGVLKLITAMLGMAVGLGLFRLFKGDVAASLERGHSPPPPRSREPAGPRRDCLDFGPATQAASSDRGRNILLRHAAYLRRNRALDGQTLGSLLDDPRHRLADSAGMLRDLRTARGRCALPCSSSISGSCFT